MKMEPPRRFQQGDKVVSRPGAGQPQVAGTIAYIERDIATITMADGKRAKRSVRNLRLV